MVQAAAGQARSQEQRAVSALTNLLHCTGRQRNKTRQAPTDLCECVFAKPTPGSNTCIHLKQMHQEHPHQGREERGTGEAIHEATREQRGAERGGWINISTSAFTFAGNEPTIT